MPLEQREKSFLEYNQSKSMNSQPAKKVGKDGLWMVLKVPIFHSLSFLMTFIKEIFLKYILLHSVILDSRQII